MQAILSMHPAEPSSPAVRSTLRLPVKTSTAPSEGLAADSVESMDLLRGQKTVQIRHNGATYRLQATKLGKLILTK